MWLRKLQPGLQRMKKNPLHGVESIIGENNSRAPVLESRIHYMELKVLFTPGTIYSATIFSRIHYMELKDHRPTTSPP